ncbi:hypothetical protein [Stenomitos frigidus]|nr:hypothetical protein [Stenomitos frigidus]
MWKLGVYSLFFVALINLAFTTGFIFYYRVSINPQGLRCTSFWGKLYFIEWSTITGARSYGGLWTFGFKFLLLSTTKFSSALWLPLFLHDMPRLKQIVSDYAGTSNPLAIQLKEQNTPVSKGKKAEDQIKFAWQGGIVHGTINLVFILLALTGYDFFIRLTELIDISKLLISVLLNVCLIFVLSFGIYKKSRVSAVVILIYLASSQAWEVIELRRIPGILSWFFLIAYVGGVQGTFSYHKLRGNR